MAEQPLQIDRPAVMDPGLRNAWQWLAIITMLLDHIWYLYNIEPLRYVGRLGMPLYAILFVITLQKNQLHLKRVLLLGLLSQVQYMYMFQQSFDVYSFRLPQLNIIFGFAIFAWTAEGVHQRHWLKIVTGFLMMCIPVSYGWYLYATLAIFYWLRDKTFQRGLYWMATVIYVMLSGVHPRQLLAACVPFIQGIKAPRPNKYLYRYFYPGHLLILVVLKFWILGTFTLPFGAKPETVPYYGSDFNDVYEYDDDMMPDTYEWDQDDAAAN